MRHGSEAGAAGPRGLIAQGRPLDTAPDAFEDAGTRVKFVLHDRDASFTATFAWSV